MTDTEIHLDQLRDCWFSRKNLLRGTKLKSDFVGSSQSYHVFLTCRNSTVLLLRLATLVYKAQPSIDNCIKTASSFSIFILFSFFALNILNHDSDWGIIYLPTRNNNCCYWLFLRLRTNALVAARFTKQCISVRTSLCIVYEG
jgi:hypothetical protein